MAVTVMPFGKHRGTPLAEVPKPYLRWVLDNARDLYPETRAAIVAVVDGTPAPAGPASSGRPQPARARAPGPSAEPADAPACIVCGQADGRPMVHIHEACHKDPDPVPF